MKKHCIVIILLMISFVSTYAQRPNIILILSDDHSAEFMGCYNNKDVHTPHLDSLAKSGVRFTQVFTTSPQCTPSRASIMTGRSPVDIRMTRFAATLPRDIITYPELLRKAGYYTGVFGRNYHLDGSGTAPETESLFVKHNLRTFKDRVDYLKIGGNNTAYPELIEFLDKVPAGKPFFIQTGYNDPHYPYDAKSFEPNPDTIAVPAGMPDLPEVRKHIAGHIGEIQRMDSLAGLILHELTKRNLAKNTLIIFMGDNGSAVLRGKGTLYDAGLHVPMIASWPGHITPSSVSDILISGEDLAPTFLEAAGVKGLPTITGKSFLPAFKGNKQETHEYIFAERGAHGTKLPNSTFDFDLSRVVFNKQYKLIYNALWQLPYTPVDFDEDPEWIKLKELHKTGKLDTLSSRLLFSLPRPMFELYDLKKDPYEFNNLIDRPDYAAIQEELKVKLQEWMLIYQDYLPLPIPAGVIKK